MEYKLRWGNLTIIPAFLMGFIVGTFILWLAHDFAEGDDLTNEGFFGSFYAALLGYFVLAAIAQSHYFKTSGMKLENSVRYFASIGAAVLFFGTNFAVFSILDVDPGQHIHGHFLFILLGFYLYGFDDFLFAGKISELPSKLWAPLSHPSWKAAMWYVAIWLLWGLLVSMDTIGDPENFNKFAGNFQWTIILSLLCAIQLKDLVAHTFADKTRNPFVLGTFWLMFTIIGGIAIGHFFYMVNDAVFNIQDGDNWHHVLYQGTYPLTPAIVFGLYTNHLNHVPNLYKRTAMRLSVVAGGAIILYFFYHLVVMGGDGSGLITLKLAPGHDYDWWHSRDLYWNFTVSIIPLTWSWFCARLYFLVPVEDEKKAPVEEEK